jgi:TIR domain
MSSDWDFFIAHAGPDTEKAEELYSYLHPVSRVFLDARCLLLGDDWDRELAHAQRSSLVTVVLISSRTEDAYYQREEIAAAIALARDQEGQHRVIPVFLDDESRSAVSVPYGLRLKHGITLTVEGSQRNVAHRLLQELPQIRNKTGIGHKTVTIVLDESYCKWVRTPPDHIGYKDVLDSVAKVATVISNKSGYSSQTSLPTDGILIFPTPRDTIISETEISGICDWVARGGALLVMGIYLVEVHHRNNINKLTQRFGFEFKDNLMMPPGRFKHLPIGVPVGTKEFQDCMGQAFELTQSDFCILSDPHAVPAEHPMLNGVSTLGLTSSCTIECATAPDMIVSTDEPVAVLHGTGFKDSFGTLVRVEKYVLDALAPAQFMVAVEYGKGKVVGIGTWKVFLNAFVTAHPNGNCKLFHNVIDWLR